MKARINCYLNSLHGSKLRCLCACLLSVFCFLLALETLMSARKDCLHLIQHASTTAAGRLTASSRGLAAESLQGATGTKQQSQTQQTTLISASFVGRFGNMLFIFAALIGVSKRSGSEIVVPGDCPLFSYFHHLSAGVCWSRQRSAVHNWLQREHWNFMDTKAAATVPTGGGSTSSSNLVLYEGKPGVYDASLVDRVCKLAAEGKSAYLSGFFQSWRYFHDNAAAEVRRQMELTPSLLARADTKLAQYWRRHISTARDDGDGDGVRDVVYVGVHVRREDFVVATDSRLPADSNYLIRAVKYFKTKYLSRNLMFVVCSTKDGIEWSKRIFLENKTELGPHTNVVFSGDDNFFGDFMLDFAILVSCNHTIVTVGSFGWWAAYLNRYQDSAGDGQIVLYQKDMFVRDSAIDKDYELSDYMLPDWIPL